MKKITDVLSEARRLIDYKGFEKDLLESFRSDIMEEYDKYDGQYYQISSQIINEIINDLDNYIIENNLTEWKKRANYQIFKQIDRMYGNFNQDQLVSNDYEEKYNIIDELRYLLDNRYYNDDDDDEMEKFFVFIENLHNEYEFMEMDCTRDEERTEVCNMIESIKNEYAKIFDEKDENFTRFFIKLEKIIENINKIEKHISEAANRKIVLDESLIEKYDENGSYITDEVIEIIRSIPIEMVNIEQKIETWNDKIHKVKTDAEKNIKPTISHLNELIDEGIILSNTLNTIPCDEIIKDIYDYVKLDCDDSLLKILKNNPCAVMVEMKSTINSLQEKLRIENIKSNKIIMILSYNNIIQKIENNPKEFLELYGNLVEINDSLLNIEDFVNFSEKIKNQIDTSHVKQVLNSICPAIYESIARNSPDLAKAIPLIGSMLYLALISFSMKKEYDRNKIIAQIKKQIENELEDLNNMIS